MPEQHPMHLTQVELSVGVTEHGNLAYGLRLRLNGLDAEAQGHALGVALRAVHEAIDQCQSGLHAGSHADFWGGLENARIAGLQAHQQTIYGRSDACERPSDE